MHLLFGTSNMILLVPSTFSCNWGGIFILTFILVLPVIIYYYFVIFDHCSENKTRDRIILISSITLIFTVIFVVTFFNHAIFYEDKIISKNIFNIKGKVYNYNDVSKVEIYSTSGKGSTGLHYDLRMFDGLVININSLRYNIKNIKRYDNHTFNDLFYIEDKIKTGIPHSITESSYKELLRQGITFPNKIKDKFKFEN